MAGKTLSNFSYFQRTKFPIAVFQDHPASLDLLQQLLFCQYPDHWCLPFFVLGIWRQHLGNADLFQTAYTARDLLLYQQLQTGSILLLPESQINKMDVMDDDIRV
jgi:hypothetical protein